MLKLSDEAKAKYAKYVGTDGKLIIDDSLPEDLKETFRFFNEKNINVLEMNINDDIEVLDDEPDISNDIDDDSDIEDYSDIEEQTSNIDVNLKEDDSMVDLDNLNDLFN